MHTQTQTPTELALAALNAQAFLARQPRPTRSSEFGYQGLANNPLARTIQARPRLT